MGLRLWDYYCSKTDSCGFTEIDRLVQYADQDAQECPECGELLTRVPAVTVGWIVDAERTRALLKARSEAHTRNMMERGHDPRANETQRNTNEEWRTKTRAKVHRKGLVQENAKAHEKWAADNAAMGIDDAGDSLPLRNHSAASKIVSG